MPVYCARCHVVAPCVSALGLTEAGWECGQDGWRCGPCKKLSDPRTALRKLISVGLTCSRRNEHDWMAYFAECLTTAMAAIGEPGFVKYLPGRGDLRLNQGEKEG